MKISLPNSNQKVFIPKKSNVEMLVGVASLPPSFISALQKTGIYIIKRQNCLNICKTQYMNGLLANLKINLTVATYLDTYTQDRNVLSR